jgi:hypothetical protein
MKNLLSHFKAIIISALNIIFFISSMYLSIIFFLILMTNESVKGKKNPMLKEELSSFIQKISDLPESFFPQEGKKEVDLSGGLY